MGIENVGVLTGDEDDESTEGTEVTERPTDQEIKDRQQDELAEAREVHNQRVGAGSYAKNSQTEE